MELVAIIKSLAYLILGPLITLISLPLLIIVVIINEIARYIVTDLLSTKYFDKVTLVSDGADGIWGYKKPGSSRNVVVLVSTERGFLSRDMARSYFEDILFKVTDSEGHRPYAKFKKILTRKYGYVCWEKDDNFDVNNQIRVLDEDVVYTEKEVLEFMSQLSEDMDESKPQWEFIIFPKYIDESGEEKSVLLIRFLHAYMDGLSFIMLLKEYWSTGFEYSIHPLKFKIAFWKMALLHLNTFLYGPLLMYQMLYRKYNYKPWILNDSLRESPSKKNYGQSKYMDTKIINKIRLNHPGTTLTNVISTAFVTAATKVLPKDRLINEIRVGELIAILPYPNSHPQNRFTNFSFDVPTYEENPIQKLQRVKKDSLWNLIGPQALLQYYSFKIFGRFPCFTLPWILDGALDSLFLSNVPCAKKKFKYLNGPDMIELAAWPPQVNDTGIVLASLSYNGQLKVSGSADSKWLTRDELHKILELIPFEIKAMADLCPYNNATWKLPEFVAQEEAEALIRNNNNNNNNNENIVRKIAKYVD